IPPPPASSTVTSLSSANLPSLHDALPICSSANTLAGIAISSYTVDATKGNWQYSTDGSTWTTLGSAATTTAIELHAADLLRFVPAANHTAAATTPNATVHRRRQDARTTGD